MAKRHEVPLEDTWNLDDLFATETAFNEAQENVKNRGLAFVKKYQGQIKDAKTPDILLESFHELKTIMGEASPDMLYAMLDFSADMTDADKRARVDVSYERALEDYRILLRCANTVRAKMSVIGHLNRIY